VTQIHEKNQVIELLEMKGHKGMQLKMGTPKMFFQNKTQK
jgi:hypothetical protein